MKIDLAGLEGALEVLGQLLADRSLHYEVAAIGGGSLLLLGLIDRTTKDLDLVAIIKDRQLCSANPLPPPLVQAAEEVGRALDLGKDWLNIGPAALLEMGLPTGFMGRLHIRKYKGLTLYLADRFDQICFKLYASVDQGPKSKHFADLLALIPIQDELHQAKNWCITQDVSSTLQVFMGRSRLREPLRRNFISQDRLEYAFLRNKITSKGALSARGAHKNLQSRGIS